MVYPCLLYTSITDSRFDEQFGFTDEEVRKLLSDYGIDSHFDEVKEWYDGYHFGRADVYCCLLYTSRWV